MQPRGLPTFTVLPKSRLGIWSAYCAITFVLAMALILWLAVSQALTGVGLDPVIFSLALKIFLAAIAAGALVTGVLGMIKRRERSVATFISIAVGFFGLLGTFS